MVECTKNFFHLPENQQLYLEQWQSTTLQSIIAENPDKSLSQNLELLIDKLQKIHTGLAIGDEGKFNLCNILLSACQGIPVCRIVLLKPTSTFKSIATELWNAISSDIRCQNLAATQQYHTSNSRYYKEDEDANEQFWVDQRYEGRGGYHRQGTYQAGYKGGGYKGVGHNNNTGYNKKCFVYNKIGC